jgi:hypothetical protein
MSASSFATSVNTIRSGTSGHVNVQNARIKTGTGGWVVADNSTFESDTEKRQTVLFPAIKPSPTTAGTVDVGVTYNYDDTQKRTVKATNGNNTSGIIVFTPSHL